MNAIEKRIGPFWTKVFLVAFLGGCVFTVWSFAVAHLR